MPRQRILADRPLTHAERQRRYWARKREPARAAFAALPEVSSWFGIPVLRSDLLVERSRPEKSGGHAENRGN